MLQDRNRSEAPGFPTGQGEDRKTATYVEKKRATPLWDGSQIDFLISTTATGYHEEQPEELCQRNCQGSNVGQGGGGENFLCAPLLLFC